MSDIDPITNSDLSKCELSEQELEKATGGGTNEKAGGGKGADQRPTETVGLNYGKIEWVYTTQ